MTIFLIIIIFIISIVFYVCSMRKAAKWIGGFAVLACLAIGSGAIPKFLLGGLQEASLYEGAPYWGSKNAIVFLGMTTEKNDSGDVYPGIFSYSRIVSVAKAYKSCQKSSSDCKVIVSGGDPVGNGVTEASIYAAQLLDLGVNYSDISLENMSRNTFENAKFSAKMLAPYRSETIVLVTSAIHLKRSQMYFNHFGVTRLTLLPADYVEAKFSLIPSAYNFLLTDVAIHEYIGMGRYHLYNFFGLNLPKPGAGVAENNLINDFYLGKASFLINEDAHEMFD